MVGLPEGRIPLAHATVYLATAPKSNSAYAALGAAMKEVTEGRTLAVPVHLRSTGYKGAKDLGHGKDYQYAHDFEGNYIPQAYLPEGLLPYRDAFAIILVIVVLLFRPQGLLARKTLVKL